MKKFQILKNKTNTKIIALGGINKNNIKKLKLLDVYGFAGISFFKEDKKNGPLKKGPFKFIFLK
jgi:hypothetical protein